jgi:hypothetical protein
MREFAPGAVLTITTGKLLTEFDNLYQILSYLTGYSIMTHEISGLVKEFQPYILDLFPELEKLNRIAPMEELEDMVENYPTAEGAVNAWLARHVGDRKFIIPQPSLL